MKGRRVGAGGAGGVSGGGAGDREGAERVSREMFVIGGAGTDPIRVRAGLWV